MNRRKKNCLAWGKKGWLKKNTRAGKGKNVKNKLIYRDGIKIPRFAGKEEEKESKRGKGMRKKN